MSNTLAEPLEVARSLLEGALELGVVADNGDLDGARGHKVLP
jgi:hypothetical protein|tara:strand:+ start:223 stop:348 length:126 start_codon:yes stop_codon:yes gene_type:complete